MYRLCGYDSFGHRAVAESLAGTPENVSAFLGILSRELRPRLEEDLARMLQMKVRGNPRAADQQRLEVWDVPYFSARARSELCGGGGEDVSEYFSLGACMEGLDAILRSVFGAGLEVEEPEPGEVWHRDVRKLAVREAGDGALLGHVYCDFFARPGKPHQDCHFTIRGGRRRPDGSYQNPAVVLMLSLPPPSSSPGWGGGGGGAPTLLSGGALDNLFHEMGHAMHSMLGRTEYQHVTGTRCPTDFAEVPSTLMEYFASEPAVLSRVVGRHHRTGRPLPLEAARRHCAAKRALCAADVHAQLLYSLVDQELHSAAAADLSRPPPPSSSVVERLHGLHHPLPFHRGAAWRHRFSHLVGYGAR